MVTDKTLNTILHYIVDAGVMTADGLIYFSERITALEERVSSLEGS